MILERLSKNNQKWQSVALGLCGNKEDANDLVNDFYIRMYEKVKDDSGLKDSYFHRALINLFIEQRKRLPNFVSTEFLYDLSIEENEFNADDQEAVYIDRFNNKLTKEEQDLLLSNYDNSMREVARISGNEYYTTNRILADLRVRCLREDYTKMYSNKRDNLRLK